MKALEYKVVSRTTIETFEYAIELAIMDGWVPIGNLVTTFNKVHKSHDDTIVYSQAMLKTKKE